MDMGKPMPPGAPAPEGAGGGGGGVSKSLADAHSGMMKVMDAAAGKMPEIEELAGSILQQMQALADALSQPAGGGQPKGPAMPGTTSTEAGAANVKPAL